MSNQPPKAPFKPAVATNTPNPAQQPTRTIPQTAEAIARAEALKERQAHAETQARLLKSAEDKGFHAGEIRGERRGVTKGLIIGIASCFVACGLIIALTIGLAMPGHVERKLAVGEYKQMQADEQLDERFSPPPASIAKPQQ